MHSGSQARLDAIVVGAGLMGSATAWSLARRGRSVLLIEQFTPAGDAGSSHGSARIVRRAYPEPLYTRLTGQAFELWRELEHRSGTPLLRMLGGIDFGDGAVIGAIERSLADSGVGHERLSAQEAEQRWPGMRFEGEVVYHPQAGTVDAAAAVAAFIAEAERSGARLRERARVARVISSDAAGAAVELEGGERLTAEVVVVAAGGWAGDLLSGVVALPALTVTQQQIFHFPRLDPGASPWPSVIDQRRLVYHLAGGRDGGPADDRKVAEHRYGTITTARDRDGLADPRSRERVVEYVRRWLPGLDPTAGGEATCLYTSTADEHFVLDRVGSVVICSACSGHGAKLAPRIGELTADLVTAPDGARVPAEFRLVSHRRAGAA